MSTLAEEMKSHALEAQKFSRKHLVLELDFSEASVEELENHYDSVGYAIRGGKSPENLEMLSRIWGAYVGEALRRATGAEWIEEESDSRRRIGLRGKNGAVVYPHEQVGKRLVDSVAGNVIDYFRSAKGALAAS